ncbi:MAG: hypothetical protein HYW25_01460 [Candidatus Aenigmarchaeota archaeon]|nr:hypothetical protein [Candidatus Aenigmarchaeota archaeon]
MLSNQASVVSLDELELKPYIVIGRKLVHGAPRLAFVLGKLVLVGIRGERLDVGEFETGTMEREVEIARRTRGEDYLMDVSYGQPVVRRHRARYARRYMDGFDDETRVLVPQDDGRIYVVQNIPRRPDHFVQWDDYSHDPEKERVLDSADCAIFLATNASIMPLVALVGKSHALFLHRGSGSGGSYRELNRRN